MAGLGLRGFLGFSLVVASGGFSLQGLLLLQNMGSSVPGPQESQLRALEHTLDSHGKWA